jgi:hypothetical protein
MVNDRALMEKIPFVKRESAGVPLFFQLDSVVSERNLPEKWGTHRG